MRPRILIVGQSTAVISQLISRFEYTGMHCANTPPEFGVADLHRLSLRQDVLS